MYCILIRRLNNAHITKLRGENSRYEKFRTECQLERDFLGLNQYYKEMGKVDDIYWDVINNSDQVQKENRRNSGFTKTIDIIIIYSDLLFYIVLCLSAISLTILVKQICNL